MTDLTIQAPGRGDLPIHFAPLSSPPVPPARRQIWMAGGIGIAPFLGWLSTPLNEDLDDHYPTIRFDLDRLRGSPMNLDQELAIKRKAAAHPDRPGERCNAPKGTCMPVVDHGRCEGKRDCIVVCPHDVFEVRTIERFDFRNLNPFERIKVVAHRGQTAYTPNAGQCAACGLCVVACPERAIRLVPAEP